MTEGGRAGRGRVLRSAVFVMTTLGVGALGFFLAPRTAPSREHSIVLHARRYEYDPPVLRVGLGDTVRLKFVSEDVVHGFYLEGYDLDVVIPPLRSTVQLRRPESRRREVVEEVVFKADREGKFRYRCSETCGYLHPFMLGEMIVGPNRLLPASVGMAVGMLLGSLLSVILKESSP